MQLAYDCVHRLNAPEAKHMAARRIDAWLVQQVVADGTGPVVLGRALDRCRLHMICAGCSHCGQSHQAQPLPRGSPPAVPLRLPRRSLPRAANPPLPWPRKEEPPPHRRRAQCALSLRAAALRRKQPSYYLPPPTYVPFSLLRPPQQAHPSPNPRTPPSVVRTLLSPPPPTPGNLHTTNAFFPPVLAAHLRSPLQIHVAAPA
eukprot:352103-Chlamydomonas_euryale.AAC.10